MPSYKLELTLTEPFSCGARPLNGNEIGTLDYIPGTNIRGSLAAALHYCEVHPDLERWFGFSKGAEALFRYSPAWPCDPENQRTAVPMPLSFLYDKGDDGLQGKYGVWNQLVNSNESAPAAETDAAGKNTGHSFQWTRPRHRWLAIDGEYLPIRGFNVPLENSMHVGLHYSRRAFREGALYSQTTLPRGTKFAGIIQSSEKLPSSIPELLFLGKRRSAERGGYSSSH